MRTIATLLLLGTFAFCIQAQRPPLNMTLLDSFHDDSLPSKAGLTYNDIWGYVDCDGREYAIVGGIEHVLFIDLDHPDGAREIARFAGGGSNFWRDIKTYRDRAYAIADKAKEGLLIFDLSQLPDTVLMTQQTDSFFTNAHNIFVDEPNGKLYVAGSDSADFVVLDLTDDPDHPSLWSKGSYPTAGYVHDVYVKDNIAYCSHGENGFWIWDFNHGKSPQFVASIPTLGYNHSSWMTEDGQHIIYAEEVPTGVPLGIIDLSDVSNGNLEIINTFKFPLEAAVDSNARPHNPFIRDHYAVVSYYQDGLQIFDIADPMNPKQVAYYDTYENSNYPPREFSGNWGVYPYLPSGRLIASDIEKGLLVLRADSIAWSPISATTLAAPEITQTPIKEIHCKGDTVVLKAPDGAATYAWTIGSDSSATWYEQAISLAQSDSLVLEMTNGHCSAQASANVSFSALESPEILIDGERLFTFVNNVDYQWYLNNQPIEGANQVLYDATQSGIYKLEITDDNGCTAQSNSLEVNIVVTKVEELSQIQWTIAPNPFRDFIQLTIDSLLEAAITIALHDLTGRQLWERTISNPSPSSLEFDTRALSDGLYLMKIQMGDQIHTHKLLKTRSHIK
ncbi:MAG: choice-of-anchor B family protein [Bacteroidota bacterium]